MDPVTNARLPRVLVLLATFNGEQWLDEQLASIFAQDSTHVFVVASDHGSTDGTLSLLRQWQSRRKHMAILPGAAPGRGAAANFLRLIRDANAEGYDFVALADQDDIWMPDHLHRAIQALACTGAAAYSSDALAFWPDGRSARLGKSSHQRRFDYMLEPAGAGCTYVMTGDFVLALRAELSTQTHRFEATSYHDWLIYVFARTHGHRWFIDEYPSVRYRQHGRNDVGANIGFAGIRRRWERSRSGLFRRQVLHMGGIWPDGHAELLERFRRFNWIDRLYLAASSRRLRRRPKDQLALFSMLLLGVLG
jgi:rhamnosyltransferase